jgi:hypothetical protein
VKQPRISSNTTSKAFDPRRKTGTGANAINLSHNSAP